MRSDELGTRVLVQGLAEIKPGRSDSIPTVSLLGVRAVIPVMGVAIPVMGVAIPVMGVVTGGVLTAEEEGSGWGHAVT